ncbi:MAG: helix-turn-helix transcriptional regulator [Treponema sp.]|nr:helix-turn-helix transcriptional regulator [Treponema sp.]
MLTPIGKYLRKLRIDLEESMEDMAKRLGISKTYLSFIENGSREISQDFAEKIMEEYRLAGNEKTGDFLSAYYSTPVKTVTLDTEKIKHLSGGIEKAQQIALALPKMTQEQFAEFSSLFNKFIIEHNIQGVIGDLS